MMVKASVELPADLHAHVRAVREAQLPRIAKEERKRFEEAGITFQGASIRTDAEGQAKINGAMIAFTQGMISHVDFMTVGGDFLSLDAEGFGALYAAVVAHVQDSFSRLLTVQASIDAGTATPESVRAAFA